MKDLTQFEIITMHIVSVMAADFEGSYHRDVDLDCSHQGYRPSKKLSS